MKVYFQGLEPGDRILAVGNEVLDAPHTVAAKPERDRVRLVNPVEGGTEWWLYKDNPSLTTNTLEIERTLRFGELALIVGGDDEYDTPDARFHLWLQKDYLTTCDEPHTVAETGYACPGDETHTYSRWDIWDNEKGDYIGGNGPNALETFDEAVQELREHLAEKKKGEASPS